MPPGGALLSRADASAVAQSAALLVTAAARFAMLLSWDDGSPVPQVHGGAAQADYAVVQKGGALGTAMNVLSG